MGVSVKTPAVYQPVEVSGSKWIHARSLFDLQVTACGFSSQGGAFVFTKTDAEVTCPFCCRALGQRRAS